MEKLKKKLLFVIAFVFMLYSMFNLFILPCYATNETNGTEIKESNETAEQETIEDNKNDNNNEKTNTTTNKTTTTAETKKSNNAKLKNLGIRPHDFSGFKSGTTSYDVTVPGDTESVEVYATAQDSNAKISGTGTKKLEVGKNTLSVIVTAEDGTKQTYTINVTRQEEKEENTENVQEKYTGEGLASLKLEELELSPKFDTTIYEYTVKYIGEDTKLNIETTTTDPYYTTEIIGNSDLKEGENTITILVSDPDGENVATYQITVNKSKVDEEALKKEQEEKQKEEQRKYLIIAGVTVAIILVIIIILIIRHRRNKVWAEEYSIPYSGLKDERDNEPLENYDENMNYVEDKEIDAELSKEQAREKFLNNYNSNDNYEEYEDIEETQKKKKHKGKRFK